MFNEKSMERVRSLLTTITPPGAINLALYAKHIILHEPVEWAYMPDGWRSQLNPNVKGWNVESVLHAYEANWSSFVTSLEGSQPLGVTLTRPLPTHLDFLSHNTLVSYGYALAIASRRKTAISMLDWGGGIGHYYLISQALLPDLQIDYHCKDVPLLASKGQSLFPDTHYYADDTCLARQFDFVLASSSLQYSEGWTSVLAKLSHATGGYIFVTRLPIIHKADSFVAIQRPYRYGYGTEYLGWCFNRVEFLECAKTQGLELIREFIIGEQPAIRHAPEQCEYRGYLFRSQSQEISGVSTGGDARSAI